MSLPRVIVSVLLRAVKTFALSALVSQLLAFFFISWEALISVPLASLCILPGILLFLVVQHLFPEKPAIPHVIYLIYCSGWLGVIGLFLHEALRVQPNSQIAMLNMIGFFFLTIAGLLSYIGLQLTEREQRRKERG